MSIYAPFRDDVEEQHRNSLRHVARAVAYPATGDPIELGAVAGTLTFDSSWSPYLQSTDLTCALPADPDTVARLDPIAGCRVKVFAGYVYDGKVEDVHLLGDLHLRTGTEQLPGNLLKLSLASDEMLAQDYRRLSWDTQQPVTGINELVTYHANIAAAPIPATVSSDFPAAYGASLLAGLTQDIGATGWAMVSEAADRLGVRVFVDENRVWRITAKPDYAGVTALNLHTGAGGTITDIDASRTRGDNDGAGFSNAVCLKYSWRDSGGVDREVFGNAAVTTGPLRLSAIGWQTHYEERGTPVTQAQADAAASTVLKSRLSMGRVNNASAGAAYWLRPGHTVTVQRPGREQERLIVRGVTFSLGGGAMSLTLRQPLAATISTNG